MQFQSTAFDVALRCLEAIVSLTESDDNHESISKLAESAKVILAAARNTVSGTAIPAPTFIDAPKLIGTVGAKKAFCKIGVAASFTHVHFIPQDTKGASNLYDRDVPSKSPSADGKYTQTFEILNVNGTYTF